MRGLLLVLAAASAAAAAAASAAAAAAADAAVAASTTTVLAFLQLIGHISNWYDRNTTVTASAGAGFASHCMPWYVRVARGTVW